MSPRQSAGPRVYSKRKGAERPPADAVYVGRPTKFGNPFPITGDSKRAVVVAEYRQWLNAPGREALREAARHELRGKDLVCWCAPLPCHADVLLEVANA